MIHIWYYYYKGTRGRKKYFDGGSCFNDNNAAEAIKNADRYCDYLDDADGDMERKTGTKNFDVAVYITHDTDNDTVTNKDGSQTVTFNPKNVIYHQDTRTGKYYENKEALMKLGALVIWHA